MTNPLAMLFAVAAFLLVIFAFRFAAGSVAGQVSSQPPVFPTAKPFESQLCGKDNRDCTLNFDWQKPTPFRGLTLNEPPR